MSPLLAGLCVLSATPALAQDERDEDAIFGGTTPAEATAPPTDPAAPPTDPAAPAAPPTEPVDPTAPDRDDAVMNQGSTLSAANIADTLGRADERLAIGGKLYLRFDASFTEDAAGTEDVDERTVHALSSDDLFDVYLDTRPNDRLRAYTQLRLKHRLAWNEDEVDFYGDEVPQNQLVVDQLYLKFDVAHRLYATVGRQRVKWGAGRFWNPTDFVNQEVLDPLAAYDLRTGVALVKLHLPLEMLGMNVYGIANLEGATELDQVGGAGRVEWAGGNTEITASVSGGKDEPTRLGGDLSTGLWLFDLHVEGAVTQGLQTSYWEGDLDWANGVGPTEVSRAEDWVPQVTAGLELTLRLNDEDTLSLGAEGFYNDAGYDDAHLYPWVLASGGFQPFYLGRTYAAAYAYLPGPGNWDDHSFTASWIANLSDGSMVGRVDWRATLLTHLSVNAYASGYFGQYGEFRLKVDEIPVPDVENLVVPVNVPATRASVGLGLQLSF